MKTSIKRLCAALAVSAVAASATSVLASAVDANYSCTNFPYDQYGITAEQVAGSKVQPAIAIEKKTIKLADAKNPQTLDITISGADAQYNAFGFHVAYDSRLTVNKTRNKIFSKGDALEEFLLQENDIRQPVAGETDGLIFFAGAASGNAGYDGVMTTMNFSLPSDAKAGDIYYVGFEYHNSASTEDQFVASPNNTDSKIMQGWVFTKGLQNGYIQIEAEQTSSSTSSTTSTTTTTTTTTTSTTTESETSATDTATTTAESTTSAATTTAPSSPPTGVKGVGVAAAGLAAALGTAFVLRKKED